MPAEGLDEPILVTDGGGVVRTQVWHYPSRSECLVCHTAAGGYALGFNTAQLNRDADMGGGPANQIQTLSAAGYFQTPATNVYTLPALASLTDQTVSREYRVRSYLAANCVQCHQPAGSARGLWDARLATPTRDAGLVNGSVYNNLGNPDNRVIKPGSVEQSTLLTRISQLGPGHMPPLATTVIDTTAVNLVQDWVTIDLPASQDFPAWQMGFFQSTNAPASAPDADPDGDGASNYLEYLTGGNPLNSADPWTAHIRLAGPAVQISVSQPANRAVEVQFTPNVLPPLWQPLDVPGNQPFFPSTNRVAVVQDVVTNEPAKLYRVTVRDP